VDKNYPIKAGRREGDITSLMLIQIKANTVLGWKAQSSLEEAMKWKMEQKVREQQNNDNEKCCFEFICSVVQRL
jgi:UDP-glucose 4-epimerase